MRQLFRSVFPAVSLLLAATTALAQAPVISEAAKEMVGAWEISNAAHDKVCPLTFSTDTTTGGFRLDLDEGCGTTFPALKQVAAWNIGAQDTVRLLDQRGTVILDFVELESKMFEAERKGEGLFFLRTQAAVRAATVTPEQVVGEWTLLQEFETPLCRLTLSNAAADAQSYRLTVKPGCTQAIASFGLTSWRLESNELLLSGNGGTWRFSESDANIWERVPPSTDPLLLMKQ